MYICVSGYKAIAIYIVIANNTTIHVVKLNEVVY